MNQDLIAGDLRFSELRLMVELSQTHSLRELARRQSVHPSQLSKIIRKVEKKVGLTLIQRSSQGMVFTLEGMQFLKTARKILELSPSLRSGRSEVSTGTTFGIAGTSYIHQFLLPNCLDVIRKKNKDLNFRLIEVPTKDLMVMGMKGIFEMAIHVKKLDWPKSWTSKKIGMARSALYGRSGHPLGVKTTVQKVKDYKFITPLRWTKNGIQDGDDLCPLPLQERLHGDGTMTASAALGLMKITDQVSFLPEIVANQAVSDDEIMEIKVSEWGETYEPMFLSVHSDLVSQKMLEQLLKEFEKFFY